MNRIASAAIGVLLGISAGVQAGSEQSDIEALKAQIAKLTKRLDELESARGVHVEDLSTLKTARESSAWTEKVKVSGDFRYRGEFTDDQRRDKNRERNRLRARIALNAAVTDEIEVGLGLASGSSDPTSTNQTLGNAASTKSINLDLAYFNWKFAPNLRFSGGKMKNPHYAPEKSGLVWDGDLRPEGLVLAYDDGSLFGYAGVTFLESDSGSNGTADTAEIYALQAGYRADLGGSTLVLGASYIDIPIDGEPSFLDGACEAGSSYCFGNSFNPDGTFAYDFQELEGFVEWQTHLGKLPLAMYGQFVRNLDAGSEDTGYAAGIRLGKAKNPGTWQISYMYRALEADAVLGMLSDSDFGGGGADNEGHLFKAAYALAKNTTVSASYFLNTYGEHTRAREYDFDRLQLDLQFKY